MEEDEADTCTEKWLLREEKTMEAEDASNTMNKTDEVITARSSDKEQKLMIRKLQKCGHKQ